MDFRMKVGDDFVQQLIENGGWDKAGITPRIDEAKKKSKKDEEERDCESEDMQEEVQGHTCPLCESELEEELSDDVIAEHIESMYSLMEQILEEMENEEGETIEEDEELSEDEEYEYEYYEEDEDDE
jgi:DNA repair exonuclease SbcCD ATPase subunit